MANTRWYSLKYLCQETPAAVRELLAAYQALSGIDQRFSSPGGSDIRDCCRIAVETAKVIDAHVMFVFNDVPVVAFRHDDPSDLVESWYAAAYGRHVS